MLHMLQSLGASDTWRGGKAAGFYPSRLPMALRVRAAVADS